MGRIVIPISQGLYHLLSLSDFLDKPSINKIGKISTVFSLLNTPSEINIVMLTEAALTKKGKVHLNI